MKGIGRTENGGHLIEMTQEEYREFVVLQDAVEGFGYPSMDKSHYGFMESFDFTKTFHVIRAYYRERFLINQFQELLNTMKESLEKESE